MKASFIFEMSSRLRGGGLWKGVMKLGDFQIAEGDWDELVVGILRDYRPVTWPF